MWTVRARRMRNVVCVSDKPVVEVQVENGRSCAPEANVYGEGQRGLVRIPQTGMGETSRRDAVARPHR
jgi:hypothetical protein